MRFKSPILKLALFATGLSGIVAEYILCTLATYFLGDSVLQWTLIVSIMLFSMGIGSKISKYIESNLFLKFIYIEFLLSILVSFSSLLAYISAGYTAYTGFIIYALSIAIGLLIGLEIPLVIRINKEFESLKVNISSVLELDYLGSLVGGLFFAFVGLPYLGLTYTPFVLGVVNFAVATILFLSVRKDISGKRKSSLTLSFVTVLTLIIVGVNIAQPVILHGEQKRYTDKVIYSTQSKYQRIVMTQWQDDYWLYLNGNQQFSTIDEDKYHEPLVHPAMQISKMAKDVLILGGGDGCAAREILKYPTVESITLVDLDPAVTELCSSHPILKEINQGSLSHSKVNVLNEDGFNYLTKNQKYYDVIIVDLPDPKTIEINRLYSLEFYKLCYRFLRPNGVIVTQAGSPYFATKAFKCIETTLNAASFNTAMLHNHVITLGEWGWILGVKKGNKEQLKNQLQSVEFKNVKTQWINNEAMLMMTSFGKEIYFDSKEEIEVNKIHSPVLYQYYLKGNWDLY